MPLTHASTTPRALVRRVARSNAPWPESSVSSRRSSGAASVGWSGAIIVGSVMGVLVKWAGMSARCAARDEVDGAVDDRVGVVEAVPEVLATLDGVELYVRADAAQGAGQRLTLGERDVLVGRAVRDVE